MREWGSYLYYPGHEVRLEYPRTSYCQIVNFSDNRNTFIYKYILLYTFNVYNYNQSTSLPILKQNIIDIGIEYHVTLEH